MSWKASLSRHLPVLRFFACQKSPSSRGLIEFYNENYDELTLLNPNMPLLLRTCDNAMPAITTELSFSENDLLRYMIQENKFVDESGTVSEARVEAAKAYLKTDWPSIQRERWSSPGFDPERPSLEEDNPNWRDDPKITKDLELYLQLKGAADEQMEVIKSGPDDEYFRAKNSLLMCQRVDLYCAGKSEVEAAVKHLLHLGQRFNDLEPDFPEFITEFYPGVGDLE